MKKIKQFLRWIFDPVYRKRQWQEELSFVQERIKQINRELNGREEFVCSIHNNAVDKNSVYELERYQARMDDTEHNKNLLERYIEREKKLLNKLK